MMTFLLFIFSIISQTDSYKEKFCFNCKYFIPSRDQNVNTGRCKIFSIVSEDTNFLVSGVRSDNELSYKYYCSTARSCDTLCGPSGHYHVRKYKKK